MAKEVIVEKNTENMIKDDPMEEIFALNMGDFLTEHLISGDLLNKINTTEQDKVTKLKNQLKELISIYSFDKTLTLLGFNSEEEHIIYNSIAKTITQMLDIADCHIFIHSDYTAKDKHDLNLCGSSSEVDFNKGFSLEHDDIVTEAYKSSKTIFGKDKTNSFAVPMASNAGKVGVIFIENKENKEIMSELVSLIEITAKLFVTSMRLKELINETELLIEDEFVTTMELTHLRTELTAIIGDLGDEQQLFVESLASASDAKGNYQKEHSTKVAELARKLCQYLKLNEKTTDLIYYAGLLQNIGKITVPKEIFNKQGKLTDEDWKKLQNHPNIGVSLLMKVNFLSEVVPYIHYHQERWNGQGKPEGLAGHSIPLGSRIIAVADAYKAMVSERPYRKALSRDEAIEVMEKEAGIKWDPIIVDALKEVK